MRCWWLVFWLVLPACAIAQQADVQTGEHADFTRVVVTIPAGADWQLGRNDDGYLLRVPDIDGFDLDGFFDLIPPDRIADVQSAEAGSALQFFSECLCYVDAFLEGTRFLVVDIRSGTAPPDAAFEQSIEGRPNKVAQLGTVSEDRLPQVNRGILPLLFDRPMRRLPAPQTPEVLDKLDPVPQEQSLPEAREEDLAAIEQSIAESLARGLSQGLLEPDLPDADDQRGLDALRDLLPPGVTARTGVDLAAVPPDPQVQLTQQGQICPPDHFFAVAEWGDARPFNVQMGEARAKLTSEFDRVDEEAVLTQARLLLYFGFGREAAHALAIDGKSSQERLYLLGMASAIDGDPVPEDLFAQQVSCVADVALWAFLSVGEGGLDGKADPTAILRAFKALPNWLQVHLGPRLSERFLAIGDTESALQSLEPSVAQPVPKVDAALVETDLLQELGESARANSNLKALSRDDPRTTPDVMTAFLKAAVEQGFEVTPDDFMLADALRFQSTLTPEAARLGDAQARAYLASDQFAAANALISELSNVVPPDGHRDLVNGWISAMTQRGSPDAFLAFIFRNDVDALPTTLAGQIVERLLVMGFPKRALEIMETNAARDELPYQRAEALLMLGDADTAEQTLSGRNSARADALRTASQEVASGRIFDRARYLEVDPAADAWRDEAWTTLALSQDDVLRDVSAEVLTKVSRELDQTAPLADGRALVSQSQQSRDVVDRLLARFPLPAEQ